MKPAAHSQPPVLVPGVPPLVNNRTCARCPTTFRSPHQGDWPARYCSRACHQAATRKAPSLSVARGFAVHPVQREATAGRTCIVCAATPVDPAHLIDRSLVADLDDARAVVPLCRSCHGLYDDAQTLDLLPHLEPRFREHLAFAVQRYGLIRTLERVTNRKWTTEGDTP